MPLAAILGSYLLLPWLGAGIVPSVPALAVWQSTQSQENQSSSSAPQDSSTQPSADQQKVSDQSVTPPPTPCLEKPQPDSSAKPDCEPAPSTGTKTKKRHRTHKTVAPAAPPTETVPSKKVVRNGGTDDPAVKLSPGLSAQASQQRESAEQLLAASDANLNKIAGRTLSASQQDTVKQIKSYMDQAKSALNEGDIQRAYNLALKANLLSVELVGH
jgi:cytoskeletal protein RodZ